MYTLITCFSYLILILLTAMLVFIFRKKNQLSNFWASTIIQYQFYNLHYFISILYSFLFRYKPNVTENLFWIVLFKFIEFLLIIVLRFFRYFRIRRHKN